MKLSIVVVLLLARLALAAPDDPSQAFHDAEVKAAANDPGALDALEAIGAARPVTRWNDDAYVAAAREAERAGDYARAQRDFQAAIAISTDEILVQRAHGELTRLAQRAGANGELAKVAAQHEQLVIELQKGGDPKPALRALEQLVQANPRYPRAATVMLALASGWERDGAFATARGWLDRAVQAAQPGERIRVQAEAARFATRADDFAGAERAIAAIHDPGLHAELRSRLETARSRHELRIGMWIALCVIGCAAAVLLRRGAGSWRGALRRLARPPSEVIFLAPIAVVIGLVAFTGNPLVARAVRAILGVGLGAAWLSGALLAEARPLGARRLVLHVLATAIAVVSACYLAIDRDRMIDLVVETWRSGPIGR